MNIVDRYNEDDDLIHYINESIRMVYHNEQNEEKIFWWWLNKFEYLANVTYVPDEKMAELFIEMVHENIHERVMKKYPAINFTELSYEEIINYYICYFNHSPEIISQRNSFKHRNDFELKVVADYACELRNMYSNSIYRYYLENKIAYQYIIRFNTMKLTEYMNKVSPASAKYIGNKVFANVIEIARYINPALSMINIYNSKNTGTFHEWLHKFEYVANVTQVPHGKMFEFFYNMVDKDVHSAVKMSYPSINLSELSYEEIIDFYLHYYAPTDDSDIHKRRLLCRKQYKDETIENYGNCLRKLSKKCSNTNRPDEILFEQFLNGIYDNEIKIILKKFHCFSFDEIVEFATELIKLKKIITVIQPAFSRLKKYNPKYDGEFYEWLNKFEYIVSLLNLSGKEYAQFSNMLVHNDYLIRDVVRDSHEHPVDDYELPFDYTLNDPLSPLPIPPLSYLSRRCFLIRKQYEQETIEQYAQELKKLYVECFYEDPSKKILRYQFRNGIHDYKIKTYIGKYPKLSFDQVVGVAIEYSIELSFMENK